MAVTPYALAFPSPTQRAGSTHRLQAGGSRVLGSKVLQNPLATPGDWGAQQRAGGRGIQT